MAKYRGGSEERPAGIVELPPAATDPENDGGASDVFWRCRIYLTTHVEPGAPDHVVRAADRANAEAAFFREMGILSVDRTVNCFAVERATEQEFILAQAKRLRVDLREHRQAPEGAKKNVRGEIEGFYPLTWQPPGGKQGEYVINEKGEIKPAE